MKTLLKKKSVLILTGLFLFLFHTACKHQIVEELAAPVVVGDVIGKVVLPNGTNWKGDELKVFASTGQYDIKDNKFEIKGYDLTYYSLVVAEHPVTKLTLFGTSFTGESTVEFSASSTAVALLMINPIVPYLPENKKKQLALSYSKHELFPSLVTEIESYIKQNKEFLSGKNKVYDIVNQIHTSKVKLDGKRVAGTQGTQGENETIEMKLTNNGFTLQNKASFLPYYAGVYDESGKEIKKMNLGFGKIENTGVEFLALDTYEILTNWENCWDDFGRRPTPNCKQRFFSGNIPSSQSYSFEKPGKYTVKVANATRYFDRRDDALAKAATSMTGQLIFKELVGLVNKSLAEKYELLNCGVKESLSYLEEIVRLLLVVKTDQSAYDIIRVAAISKSSAYIALAKCLSKEEEIYTNKIWENLGEFIKYLDVFGKVGSGLNLLGMTYNLKFDKNYYEYCIEVKPNEITFCKPDSIDPTKDPIIPTEVFQGGRSWGDPNIVTFDGSSYGFNGVGEFIAVKSTTDNFEIQVRQEELKNRNSRGSVSWNTGLAINTGSERLCFYPNKYFINGTQYAYNPNIDHTLPSGGNITGDAASVTVSTATGDMIKIFNLTDMLNYSVIPSIQRQGKLIGIFGDYNKDAANDLKLRNGTPIDGSYASLYPTYTDSWRITQAQSLFVYDAGKNTNSYTDRTFPRSPLAMTAAQRASAEQTCRNAGVQPPFLEGCINDVVATGNANSAQWAKALQEETVLRSFDIKFGEKEDKSLLFPNYRNRVALNYADNYLILGWASEELLLSKPIKIGKGFDFVFYLSNEIKEKNNLNIVRIRFSQLFGSFNTPLSFFINIFRDSNRYAVGDEFSGDNLPSKTPNIFDGKIHKIQLRYEFNPSYNRLTRKLWIDEIDVVSTIVNIPNNLSYKIERLKTNSFNPVFPLFETSINELGYYENTSRLYRWSFKSL